MSTVTTTYCDNCDEQIDSAPIVIVTDAEHVPSPDPDIDEYVFHFCSWECVRTISGVILSGPQEPAPEPKKTVKIKKPTGSGSVTSDRGPIIMHNVEYEERDENPQADVQVGEVKRR